MDLCNNLYNKQPSKLINKFASTVKIRGINKTVNNSAIRPKLSCFQTNGNVLEVISKRYLKISNFVFTGFKINNNIEASDQCLNGGYIRDSRHIELSEIVSHGMFNSGIIVDSSEQIAIQSVVVHDNTFAMQLDSNITRNQFNYFNKFTISNNLNGVSIQNSFNTTFINSIFYDNSSCLSSDAQNPPTNFIIKYSLCNQSGVISDLFLDPQSGNKTGVGTAYNPFFVSEDSTYQKTNPWKAFLLVKVQLAWSEFNHDQSRFIIGHYRVSTITLFSRSTNPAGSSSLTPS